jgi:SAM-dependent methyltransferase
MNMPQSNPVASGSIDRANFENFYAGKAPWDIGKPQGVFVAVADRITSPVLDAGCGTGEHALFFASRGHRVVGIDFVEEAIRRAQRKAAERGLSVDFLVKDATMLREWDARFASVIDCGLFLMCFSDEEPGTEGPRRVSRRELYDAFADGWEVESIQPVQIEVNPEFTEMKFSEGGPKAWFAVVRRKG